MLQGFCLPCCMPTYERPWTCFLFGRRLVTPTRRRDCWNISAPCKAHHTTISPPLAPPTVCRPTRYCFVRASLAKTAFFSAFSSSPGPSLYGHARASPSDPTRVAITPTHHFTPTSSASRTAHVSSSWIKMPWNSISSTRTDLHPLLPPNPPRNGELPIHPNSRAHRNYYHGLTSQFHPKR